MWLTAMPRPDHVTLWRFDSANRSAMRQVFKQTVRSLAIFGHEASLKAHAAKMKTAAAQALLRRRKAIVEPVFAVFRPGLSEHIIALDVATPVTMHRYTLNHEGAPIGWGYNNPLRWTQRAPFIPGLYQAGHWVGPSGVVNTATSGKHAAELILRDLAGLKDIRRA